MKPMLSQSELTRRHKQRCAARYLLNKESVKQRAAEWAKNNRERRLEIVSKSDKKRKPWLERYRKNPLKEIRRIGRRQNIRKQTDLAFAITARLRCRLAEVLKRCKAKERIATRRLIGCEGPALVKHLESTFLPGMTWANRALWHVDHKIPCAKFDLTNPEQQRLCFHYTNLQCLWANDNRSKGAKLL